MDAETLARIAATAPLWPGLAFLTIGLWTLLYRVPSEKTVARLVTGASAFSIVAAVSGAMAVARHPAGAVPVDLGPWFEIGGYGFERSLQFDQLSATLLVVIAIVNFVVARFSIPYLHREAGFTRFFVFFCLFSGGSQLLVTAGTIDLLFVGWELVGLSSAMLVAFFHERATPVRASLRVYTTYRLCDVGLLIGAVMMHVFAHTSSFMQAFGEVRWPEPAAHTTTWGATITALLLVVAAMGKSAQFPVGGWLARAMEGPTPSSAVFYGGVSVHLGVYLLLRAAPLLERSQVASMVVLAVGVVTALHATMVARVQSDVKSQLAYATMTQVGILFAEIGLGFYRLALVHLVLHAVLRTWQLLRSPSALRDHQLVRAANGDAPFPVPGRFRAALPVRAQVWLYRLALERFHVDTFIDRFLLRPVLRLGALVDHHERRWVAATSAWESRNTPASAPAAPARDVTGREVPR